MVKIPGGKTGARITVSIDSFPYLKEWLLEHPHSPNHDSYIFIIKNGSSLLMKDLQVDVHTMKKTIIHLY